jgi:hypothetical protein
MPSSYHNAYRVGFWYGFFNIVRIWLNMCSAAGFIIRYPVPVLRIAPLSWLATYYIYNVLFLHVTTRYRQLRLARAVKAMPPCALYCAMPAVLCCGLPVRFRTLFYYSIYVLHAAGRAVLLTSVPVACLL